MKLGIGIIGVAAAFVACSSDPAAPAADRDAGGQIAAEAGSPALDSGATPALDATTPADARPSDAQAAPPVDASAACVTYCKCMAESCASKTFPDGCLHAWASQTKWDLTCRAAHCRLAIPENNPGHCIHAMGTDQCLDMP